MAFFRRGTTLAALLLFLAAPLTALRAAGPPTRPGHTPHPSSAEHGGFTQRGGQNEGQSHHTANVQSPVPASAHSAGVDHPHAAAGHDAGSGGSHSGSSGPPGNNGTIKIDRQPFDDLPNNEPHVGCVFPIDFYG